MKNTLVVIAAIILLSASTASAGWFDNNETALIQTQQRLDQERNRSGTWQLVSGVLAVGCVGLLVFGTAIGSKARRAQREEEPIVPVFHENSPAGEP